MLILRELVPGEAVVRIKYLSPQDNLRRTRSLSGNGIQRRIGEEDVDLV